MTKNWTILELDNPRGGQSSMQNCHKLDNPRCKNDQKLENPRQDYPRGGKSSMQNCHKLDNRRYKNDQKLENPRQDYP